MDITVFRPSNGTWYTIRSTDNTFFGIQFGQNGDEPVARDYDGDRRADYAVVRREGSTGNVPSGTMTWYIRNSSNGTFNAFQFGAATDKTAPGDYDGNGRFDLAVYRGLSNSPAVFYVFRMGTNQVTSFQFGLGSDLVVPGDYDGDGRTDYAVVRTTATGYQWFIQRSSQFTVIMDTFGVSPHVPVQNDYDGDGRTDIAVWNPQNGFYYVRRSSGAADLIVQFGAPGDIAVANYDTH
jgi:hypothetical protein